VTADGLTTGNGPWRVLILDRDPSDSKWLLATIALPADVRPAAIDRDGRYTDWREVTSWVQRGLGRRVSLVPVAGALAWRADEGWPARVA
jgi:hypothetical protein